MFQNQNNSPTPRFALTLARSYDSIAVSNQYAHILYSAYKFPLGEDFNSNKFSEAVYLLRERYLSYNDFQAQKKILNSDFYIFRLKGFDLNLVSDMRLGDRFIKETLIEHKNYGYKLIGKARVLEVSLPLMSLLCEKNIYLDKNYMFNLLETLMGNVSDESKNSDSWLSHSIFIFEGFTSLYTIIELFKSFNIHLSPGGIPSRGALSTIQANLHSFLLYSANLHPFENKSVFKSYEHIAISKKFDRKAQNKDSNKKKFDKLIDVFNKMGNKHDYNYGIAELNTIGIIWKFRILFLLNYVLPEMKKDLKRYEEQYKILSPSEKIKANDHSPEELEKWQKELFDAVCKFEIWEDLITKDLNKGDFIAGDEFIKIKNEIAILYPDFKSDDYLPSNILPSFTKEVRMVKKNIQNKLRKTIGMGQLSEDE